MENNKENDSVSYKGGAAAEDGDAAQIKHAMHAGWPQSIHK